MRSGTKFTVPAAEVDVDAALVEEHETVLLTAVEPDDDDVALPLMDATPLEVEDVLRARLALRPVLLLLEVA